MDTEGLGASGTLTLLSLSLHFLLISKTWGKTVLIHQTDHRRISLSRQVAREPRRRYSSRLDSYRSVGRGHGPAH